MKIITARKAGFCFGVRRAIRMVERALTGDQPVFSLGPIIHNPQVIQHLKEKGLHVADNLDQVESGVVVIRSHGAPLHTYASLREKNLKVIDATCPFVKKMHQQARNLISEGYQLIIVGDRNHSEITSLTDDPNFRGLVISKGAELDGAKLAGRIGLISQTTQTLENLSEVASRLLPEAAELKIYNTICDSTLTRQVEARGMAARVQTMVVIGGRNSANTRRLVEICQESGTRTLWVETAAEIAPEHIEDLERIGLTSGASTPEWIIQAVIEQIEALQMKGTTVGTTLPAGRYFNNRR